MTRRARHLRPADHQVPLTILLLSHRHRRLLPSYQDLKESDQTPHVQSRLRQRAVSPNSVGVANMRDFAVRLEAEPRWITENCGGDSFGELADAVLEVR